MKGLILTTMFIFASSLMGDHHEEGPNAFELLQKGIGEYEGVIAGSHLGCELKVKSTEKGVKVRFFFSQPFLVHKALVSNNEELGHDMEAGKIKIASPEDIHGLDFEVGYDLESSAITSFTWKNLKDTVCELN